VKGFLTGIGLGTAIGLCLAPATGSDTRKKLATRAAALANSLEKKFEGESKKLDDHIHIQPPNAQLGSVNHEMLSPDPVAEVLNTASKTQLRKVQGIGDATARRIIENRPFESEAEVVESKVMPDAVLKTLKNKLVDAEEEVG
jgi:DNA uptake protein ComE-like DNA-binding protein